MPSTANFHPEWGYLAPAPSLIRKARAVLVATAVGATLGAGAVFSWASHHAAESSVGERTLVRSVEAVPALPKTSLHATAEDGLSLTEKRLPAVNSRSADGATNEPGASSTTRTPAGVGALAEAPAATEGRSTAAIAAPPTVGKDATPNVAPNKKKAMKKSNAIWRLASRDEALGLAPGEYSKRRSWGGYYGDGSGRRYQTW
jgi:hypothetical protein